MKILVINAGSSSIKYQLIDLDNKTVLAKGLCERIGIAGSQLTHKVNGTATEFKQDMKNHSVALEMVLNCLTDEKIGVIKSLNEIDGFGHRFVHGGINYFNPIIINNEVLSELKNSIDFAPLHMPAHIMGVEACLSVAPQIKNVAVFDTGFYQTLPKEAYLYAIPLELSEKHGARRYGFHGVSHKYISQEACRFLGRDINNSKVITCHIGNGASISAINNGICVETSMGFTPLEGLIMGSRSGDIDPAVLEYIMQKENWDIKRMMNCLNKESGLLGISGVSSDIRDLEKSYKVDGNERAKLAIDMMCHRIKKYIGAYSAVLGGVDVIVFSAGTGENRDDVRAQVMSNMEYLGVDFDFELNKNFTRGINFKISKENSKVDVVIIPTDEEMEIAKETEKLIKNN